MRTLPAANSKRLPPIVLDLFPTMRGLVSSLQGFVQILLSAIVAGMISPLLSGSVRHLALGMAASLLLGSVCWLLYVRNQPVLTITEPHEILD